MKRPLRLRRALITWELQRQDRCVLVHPGDYPSFYCVALSNQELGRHEAGQMVERPLFPQWRAQAPQARLGGLLSLGVCHDWRGGPRVARED